MKNKIFTYFVFTGVFTHVLLLTFLLWQPKIISKLVILPVNYYYNKMASYELEKLSKITNQSIEKQIAQVFKPWKPLINISNKIQHVEINGVGFQSLDLAIKSLKAGDELQLYDGIFTSPFAINKNDITIIGYGHVIFEKAAFRNKGFIVSKANNLTITNIECRFIAVTDHNGACIRQEGQGLTLKHVYFHHSENGILEGSKTPGNIYISDSRFELLGKNGQAHGIYSTTANLYVQNSLFIASKDEGHAIKNRGRETYISNSVITSMSSDDSRLVDVPNGGVLTVTNSFLHQGPLSVNGQAIGFGLEGVKYKNNSVSLTNNIFLLERIKQNILLAKGKGEIELNILNNIVVSKDKLTFFPGNTFYKNREDAKFPHYPYFPEKLCLLIKPCPLINNLHKPLI